jgi:hypothetical protein
MSLARAVLPVLLLTCSLQPALSQDNAADEPTADRAEPWDRRKKPSLRRSPASYLSVQAGGGISVDASELPDRDAKTTAFEFTLHAEARLLLPAGIPLGWIASYQLGLGAGTEDLEFKAGLEGSFDRTTTNHLVDIALCGVAKIKGQRIVIYPFVGYTYSRVVTEITDARVDKGGADTALDPFLDARDAYTGNGVTVGGQFSFAISESFGLDTTFAYTYFYDLEYEPLEGAVEALVESADTTAHMLRLEVRPWWEIVPNHVYLGFRFELARTMILEETLDVTVPGFGTYSAGFAESVVTRGSLSFEARLAF